jgi:hypothetical protein
MHSFVYKWSLSPQPGISLELKVVATNASLARREVIQFLAEHDGDSWTVESVCRMPTDALCFQIGQSETRTFNAS